MEETAQQQIVAKFSEMKQELRDYSTKISELQMDRSEHELVVSTLEGMDKGRKCFRMIGGVLVERTVGEVLPAVKDNHKWLTEVIQQLGNTYKQKEEELEEYVKKHNIRVKTARTDDKQAKTEASQSENSSTKGVLV